MLYVTQSGEAQYRYIIFDDGYDFLQENNIVQS